MNQNDTEWNVVVYMGPLGLGGIMVPTGTPRRSQRRRLTRALIVIFIVLIRFL